MNFDDSEEAKEPDELERSVTEKPDLTSPWRFISRLEKVNKIHLCKSLWDWRYKEQYWEIMGFQLNGIQEEWKEKEWKLRSIGVPKIV